MKIVRSFCNCGEPLSTYFLINFRQISSQMNPLADHLSRNFILKIWLILGHNIWKWAKEQVLKIFLIFKFQPFAIIVNHYYYHNNRNLFETIQRPLSHVLVFHPFIVHRAALGTQERGPICAIYTAFTP